MKALRKVLMLSVCVSLVLLLNLPANSSPQSISADPTSTEPAKPETTLNTGDQVIKFQNDTGKSLEVDSPVDQLQTNKTGNLTQETPLINTANYGFSLSIEGAGTTNPAAGKYSFPKDAFIKITATPAPGWRFLFWSSDLESLAGSSSANLTLMIKKDIDLTAHFSPSLEKPGAPKPPSGARPQALAVDLNGKQIASAVPGATGSVSANTLGTNLMPSPDEYSLTISGDGAGSTTPASGKQSYPKGTLVKITAAPVKGWAFLFWSGDIAFNTGQKTSISIVMDRDYSIAAHFIPEKALIKLSPTPSLKMASEPTTVPVTTTVAPTPVPTTKPAPTTTTAPPGNRFISGRVTQADDVTPISNAAVITVSGSYSYGAVTTADGRYTIASLPPGSYKVYAYASGYITEVYKDSYNSNAATIVSITATDSPSNINFTLDLGGTIAGHVYKADGVTPIANATVIADSGLGYGNGGAITADDGSYSIVSLMTADCKVSVQASGYITEYYKDSYNYYLATPVVVTAPNMSLNINFTLDVGGSISGYVFQADGVTPLSGATIYADSGLGYGNRVATTSGNGSYTITSLMTGNYKVYAYAAGYLTEYYKETNDYSAVILVTVSAPNITPDINFTLDLPGSISGRVFKADGTTPIANAWVSTSSKIYGGSALTSPDGSYKITGLGSGNYTTYAYTSGYLTEYYKDASNSSSATLVAVNAPNDTSGIDFTLDLGGTISGHVYQADGLTPVANVHVHADLSNASYGYGDAINTSSDGSYSLAGLPTGNYTIYAHAAGYLTEYYKDALDSNSATLVAVTAPNTISDINFTLDLGATITGHVFQADGLTPITNAYIYTYSNSSSYNNGSSTGSEGSYAINTLPSGNYTVRASASGYFTEYYKDALDSNSATLVAVTAPNTISDINFTLDLGSTITGYVYKADGATPVTNTYVYAYSNSSPGYSSGTYSASNGSYAITGLPSGNYTVRASASSYITEYYKNASNSNSATLVSVTAPNIIANINFTLEPGGTISGHVCKADGVTPMANAWVYLFSNSGYSYSNVIYTTSDGSYSFTGLPSGNYTAYATASGYILEYYKGAANSSSATPVAVTAPNTTTDINFTLDLGGTITGQVYKADGVTPVANTQIYAYFNLGYGYGSGTNTFSDGSYSITGLPSGNYTVYAQASGYILEYYKGAANSSSATPVAVTAPNTTTDINFTLDLGGTITGQVYKADGVTPVANTQIYAYFNLGYGYGSGTNTFSDGSYSITGLPSGNYTVYAQASGYLTEYYKDASNSGSATMVPVTAPDNTHDINFTLDVGGTISGYVYQADGVTPISNASMYANSSARYGYAITASDGSYNATGLPTGSYKVSASASGYIREFYKDTYDSSLATLVAVTDPNNTPNVNFNLDLGGTISGHVYKADGVTPISNVSMIAFASGHSYNNGSQSASDGSYIISGLNSGNYTVVACDAPGYLTEYYKDTHDPGLATPVPVIAPNNISDINFTLDVVSPIPHLIVIGSPGPSAAGTSRSFKVEVKDSGGNRVTGYTGSINFASSDPMSVLPGNYTFTAGDAGMHTFGLIFNTTGTHSVTATDISNGMIRGTRSGVQIIGSNAQYGGTLRWIKLIGPETSIGWPAESSPLWASSMQTGLQALLKEQIDGTLTPNLAESWIIVTGPDNPSITFYLRKGVKFQDGTDFNSQAVKWNLEQVQASGKFSNVTQNWQSFDVIDDYALLVNLKSWSNTMLNFFAGNGSFMVSPTASQKNGIDWMRWNMVGTGPFIQTEFQKDIVMKTTRNPNYWEQNKPHLDGVQFIFVADELTREALLKTGNADILDCAGNAKLADELRTLGYKIISQLNGPAALVPDSLNADSPWANIKVRQAAECAIDKTALASAFGYGYTPAADQINSPLSIAYDPTLQGRKYDPAKSKALLAEAGYPNGFKTAIIAPNNLNRDITAAIQSYWAKIGIQCDLQFTTPAQYTAYLRGGWHNALIYYDLNQWPNPDTGFNNYFGIASPFFKSLKPPDNWSSLLSTSLSTPTPDPLATQRCERGLYEGATVIPIFYNSSLWATSNKVQDTLLGSHGPASYWEPQLAWLNQTDVPLYLDPATNTAAVGQTFNMDIKTNVSSSQPVDGVDAYINFDPTLLEVIDADANQTGIQITPGSGLDTILANNVNNTSGLISYSAGKLTSSFPNGSFIVANIQFRAKAVTNIPTPVKISISGPNLSLVDFGGISIKGVHGDATVQIVPGVNVNLSVSMQGGSRPESGWQVPMTVKFFVSSNTTANDLLNSIPTVSFNTTTVKGQGLATANITGVAPGVYDIIAFGPHALPNIKRNVTISGNTAVDLGTLLEGDSNCNDIINIQDFGIIAAAYGKSSGTTGYDARADFDCNGVVNIADFGLLASNYGKSGPVLVP